MAQLNVLGRDLGSLSRHHMCSGFVKSVVTSGNWSQPSFQFVLAIVESRPNVLCCDMFLLFLVVDVVTTISYRDLIVLPFAEIYVATSFMLLAMLIFVATTFLWPLNKLYVTTWLSCFLLHSVSGLQKHVATPFLLSATDSWSQLPFSCCNLNCLSVQYLVVTWDLGHNRIVSFPC